MFTVKHRHKVSEFKRLHGIYHGIKKRCYNQNTPRYHDYGGRGIVMCDEWLDPDDGFDKFVDWSLTNGYADDLTIERIDVDGNYSPNNCKWVTLQEQRYNKRDTLYVDYHGERHRLRELCEQFGVSYDTVHDRIYKRGWDVERAIETPSIQKDSLRKKAAENGIKYNLVRDRIKKLGWDEERALNTPSKGLGANQKSYSVK